MSDRERRLTEENAVFEDREKPKHGTEPQGETETDKVRREQAKLPNKGRPAEYDELGDTD